MEKSSVCEGWIKGRMSREVEREGGREGRRCVKCTCYIIQGGGRERERERYEGDVYKKCVYCKLDVMPCVLWS